MKTHIVVLFVTLCLGGCNVVAWGNMALLGVTLALFCATLSLGRQVSSEKPADHQEQKTLPQ